MREQAEAEFGREIFVVAFTVLASVVSVMEQVHMERLILAEDSPAAFIARLANVLNVGLERKVGCRSP